MQTTTAEFRYDLDPARYGIDCSPDAEFRWKLNHAARCARTASRREFAQSLLRQFGRWTERQRLFAYRLAAQHQYAYSMWLSEACRDGAAKDYIARVGVEAALAHADSLRAEADRMEDRVTVGMEYADSHDRYSNRVWRGIRDGAAAKREKADRIYRIAKEGVR